MHTIKVATQVEASHQLEDTKHLKTKECARLHGHSYKVEASIEFNHLLSNGMAIDFSVPKDVIKQFDHRHLNDLLPMSPTAENFAEYLARNILIECKKENPSCLRVTVKLSETGKSWVEYTEQTRP